MKQIKKVLVYGATGSQSSAVVRCLRKQGYRTYGLSRRIDEKSSALERLGATMVEGDMQDAGRLKTLSQGIDAVCLLVPFFLANPSNGFFYAKNAIDAAKEAGVRLIVWNSSGFILPSKIGNPAIDFRIDVADYLKASGVPYIIIEPSSYAENLLGPWTAPFVAEKNQVAYPAPSDMRIGWITTADVAALMAEALKHPELSGQAFKVSGLQNLNGEELAQAFSEGLDKELTYYAMPPSDFGAILDNLYGEGAGKEAAAVYQHLHDSGQYPPMYTDMTVVLEKLPVKLTLLKEWVKNNSKAFIPVAVY